jgi:tight adherence protein C
MSNLYEIAHRLTSGNLTAVLLGFVGIALLIVLRLGTRAWRDVVSLEQEQLRDVGTSIMRPVMQRLAPQDEISERRLRMQLVQAGFRDENAVRRYVIMRLVGLLLAALATVVLVASGQDALRVLVVGGILLYVAYIYPDIYLTRTIAARQERIARALPSTIDLMVLCLDVGLSIEASFERVTLEMRDLEPLMADEAAQMLSEMGAGLSFPAALKRLSERIGLEELLSLARLISQASALGASLSHALREYSDQAYTKRMIGLEEKAGKISSLMVLPVTLCMLPAALLALVAPAALMLVRTFKQL